MPRSAAVLLVLVAGLPPAMAHDFWIEPTSYHPSPGSVVGFHLRVGEEFEGEIVPRDPSRIERFVVAGPDGEIPVLGRTGRDPAGLVRVAGPGVFVVGYRSRPELVGHAWADFEKYLREEGLEWVLEAARGNGRPPAVVREVFSRSVKSLLVVGEPGVSGFDRILGLTLEIVPERAPSRLRDGGGLPVRLFHEGRPVEGVRVAAFRRGDRPVWGRTDGAGRVTLPIGRPGVWLVKAVHMVPASGDLGVDWESVWGSLTFEVPDGELTGGGPGTPSRRSR